MTRWPQLRQAGIRIGAITLLLTLLLNAADGLARTAFGSALGVISASMARQVAEWCGMSPWPSFDPHVLRTAQVSLYVDGTCSPLRGLAILIAVLAVRHARRPWRALVPLLLGCALLFAYNAVRLAHLLWLMERGPSRMWFDLAHEWLWRLPVIGAALIYWRWREERVHRGEGEAC